MPPLSTTTTATQLKSTSYTKLDAIKNNLKKNEWVNTMGVLVSVGKCESAYVTTNRSRVEVRRIDILDESQTKMSVALWGAQAQNFSSPIGCILILHNVKIAYYNGISLSIYQHSQIVEYNHVFNNSNAQALKHWYDSFVSRKLAPMQPTLAPTARIDQDEGLGGGGEKQA
jgi:ssDNA-binding replication factor A large subunit